MLATFLVDTLSDTVDSDDGVTSLREAVQSANERVGEDRIVFADNLMGHLLLRRGAIEVTDTVSIEGPGADALTIDARGNDPTPAVDNHDGQPAFSMPFEFRDFFLHLSGVTITGADSPAIDGMRGSLVRVVIEGNRGGGIVATSLFPADAETWFRVSDSVFRNNSLGPSKFSAAAIDTGANLRIERSIFEGNSSGGDSGAIRARGSISIHDSSFVNNLARGDGGAIYATASARDTAEIYNSTFANNVTDGINVGDSADGSAIALRGYSDVKIVGTTISGNEIRTDHRFAIGRAALDLTQSVATMTIDRSTIVNNRHTGPVVGLADYGGVYQPDGRLTILNTVIANNSANELGLPRRSVVRHSFIGTSVERSLPPTDGELDANGNRVGSPLHPLDPQLAALVDNGSGVLTHLPLPGSRLVDAGDPQFVSEDVRMEFDQRGAPFSRVVNGRLDIGSIEYSQAESNPLIFFNHELACCTVNQPSTVESGDVDGDGDRDLVVGSFQDGSIGWFENRGTNRGFGGHRVITDTSEFVQHIRLVDLDGDGDLDILAASYGAHPVAWYENTNGQGDFRRARLISDEGAIRVAAGDIDSDGDLDVAILSATDGTLSWFRNQGRARSFAGPLTVASNLRGPDSLALADLNGDG